MAWRVSLKITQVHHQPNDNTRSKQQQNELRLHLEVDSAISRDRGNTRTEPVQKRQQPTPKRTSAKKKTQIEMLPLFGDTENPSESIPIKPEPAAVPTTYTRQTEHLSLFGDAAVASQQAEETPTEEVAAAVADL